MPHDPSFYLWDGDDGITRWWCQPCGTGGDIFDLIQAVEGVPFPEAVRRAAEFLHDLPAGYEPPAPSFTASDGGQGPETWAAQVQEARQRAAEPSAHGVMSARVGLASGDDPRAYTHWDEYLRDTWGWGLSETGEILMPHWDASGALTGCKKRSPRGERMSLPGSKYVELYGSWLPLAHREVLLCEGETDAVYAGYAARQAGLQLSVYALPSGAGSKPTAAALALLKRARRVYLAFDPDAAGVEATRTWVTFLEESLSSAVYICPLPLGRDLRAARPDMRRLLERAATRLPDVTDLRHTNGGFERARHLKEGTLWEELTTWTIDPVARVVGGDEPGYDVDLTSKSHTQRDIIRDGDLISITGMRRWAAARGLGFPGTDKDLQLLGSWLRARASLVPEIHQASRAGVYPPPPGYSENEIGTTCAFPGAGSYIGVFPRRYAPGRHEADVTGKVLLPAPGNFEWSWLTSFIELSHPSVTHPLLAWLVAAARRSEVTNFPILFITGSSGVGKSTLARLAQRLLGSAIELDLGAATAFVLMRTLACSTTFPVFVDEWTRLSRREAREALQANMPTLYAGGIVERGQADLGTARFHVTAPTIVAGEDAFTLDRELERAVALTPKKADQNFAALHRIQTQPLERFAQGLYWWLTLPGTRRLLPPLADEAAPTRIDYNRGVLEAGWRTLLLFLEESARHGEDVPELPSSPDLSCFVIDDEDASVRENVYETLLREVASLRDTSGNPVVWSDPQGRGTFIRARAAIAIAQRAQLDIELPGRSKALIAYFKERYELEYTTAQPPSGFEQFRCHLIRGFQLEERSEV